MTHENAAPLTVTMVDDHDLAVAGLQTLLTPYADRVRLVDMRQALAHPEDLDVVLYEPVGQSAFGAAMLRDLQRSAEAHPVVFSWATGDQLPASPANMYLPKTLTAAQLVVALEDLVSGRRVPEAPAPEKAPVVEAPAPAPLRPEAPAGSRLTPRELEILTLITAGMTNGEIVEKLNLSINSIKTYIRQAYRKIDVERRTQAVAWGMANNLAVAEGVEAAETHEVEASMAG